MGWSVKSVFKRIKKSVTSAHEDLISNVNTMVANAKEYQPEYMEVVQDPKKLAVAMTSPVEHVRNTYAASELLVQQQKVGAAQILKDRATLGGSTLENIDTTVYGEDTREYVGILGANGVIPDMMKGVENGLQDPDSLIANVSGGYLGTKFDHAYKDVQAFKAKTEAETARMTAEMRKQQAFDLSQAVGRYNINRRVSAGATEDETHTRKSLGTDQDLSALRNKRAGRGVQAAPELTVGG